MTPAQIARNSAIVREEADVLASRGLPADCQSYIEGLLQRAHAAGWRPVEREVPKVGGGSSAEARRAAVEAAAAAVRAVKDARKGAKA